MVFEKTLTDVVKGIRASKRDTALYISACIKEIKQEITSPDPHTKANALQKLTFLQTMGYDMSWAAFATIEVMSDTRFAYKRIGYLAASQSFTQNTDVVLLCTNLLKKELRGAIGPRNMGMYEAGLAINCLSNIVTEDLAKDLISDVTHLTTHSQSYLRKKAILCMFKIFCKYPQGLRLTFSRIQEVLEDPSSPPSVMGCAVNVVTELSYVNPKNYLFMAPSFFKLLTTSSNNWMLIKVVKLMGSLVPEEPRLARKLLEPLATIVRQTQAKSLHYEAVYTITLCLPYCRKSDGSMSPNTSEIVMLCSQTLKEFVQESDQNLKYLGLVGFTSLMSSYPKVLTAPDARPLILACLSDEDVTIRTRALGLLSGMATRKNLMELVTQLLRHVDIISTGSYKSELVSKIIELCSSEKYSLLSDFRWYIDVLVILAHTRGLDAKISDSIHFQLVDVILRVLPVRIYGVRKMIILLLSSSSHRVNASKNHGERFRGLASEGHFIMPQVNIAASWIVGEYSSLIMEAISMENEDKDNLNFFNSNSMGTHHALIQCLLHPPNIESMPSSAQSVYVQSSMKVFTGACSSNLTRNEIEACANTLMECLPTFMQCLDAEVQERANSAFNLLKILNLIHLDSLPGYGNSMNHLDEIKRERSDNIDNPTTGEESNNTEDNLLNLVLLSTPQNSNKVVDIGQVGSSLASNYNVESSTLFYLLTQEQMKPVSAKLQRKKISTASAFMNSILDKPVDIDVFTRVLSSERVTKTNIKVSIEQVSFTQQKTLHLTSTLPSKNISPTNIDSNDFFASDTKNNYSQNFSKSMGDMGNNSTISTHLREQDPFYLTSSKSQNEAKNNETTFANKFGTIELMDSDNEESKKYSRRKKDKRKKKKQQENALNDLDTKLLNNSTAPKQSFTLYSSDEGDDTFENAGQSQMDHLRPNKQNKESDFKELALVDLSAPLREDEVMPRHEHHVVNSAKSGKIQNSNKEKRKKKKKKENHSRSNRVNVLSTTTNGTADLLGFGTMPNESSKEENSSEITKMPFLKQSNSENLISNAFDDFLDPKMQASFSESKLTSPTEEDDMNGIWQKASLKAPHVNATEFDFLDKVSLHFLTNKGMTNDVSVKLKVLNKSTNATLNSVQILWEYEGNCGITQFGSIEAGNACVSHDTLGRIAINRHGYFPEITGKLMASGVPFTFKFQLPLTMSLSPTIGMKEHDIMKELTLDENWTSYSIKIKTREGFDKVGTMFRLQKFFNSQTILCEYDRSGASSILSSKTSSGIKVRALVKIVEKKAFVKVDIKSTDSKISKHLASDCKRIVLL